MSNSYFDTSMLLPLVIKEHIHHDKCIAIFRAARENGHVVSCTPHAFAELYSNLTKLPHRLEVPPKKAAEAIIEHLGSIITTIDLNRADYEAALRRCAEKELVSGIIYDALHLQAAIKAEVDVFYTANERDFRRLWDEEIPFVLRGMKE